MNNRILSGTMALTVAWVVAALSTSSARAAAPAQKPIRPPAVPLVACDPYFSIWSAADRLTDAPTTHWTKRPHRLTSLVRIDGQAFRVMGDEPAAVPALRQTSVTVLPTRTIYQFEGAGIGLSLTFTTPALPEDIDLVSRPITYLAWEAKATDGKEHSVEVYFDNTSEPAVDDPAQEVTWSRIGNNESVVIGFGTKDQPVLGKTGDDRRIDWGNIYTAALRTKLKGHAVAPAEIRDAFRAKGEIAEGTDAKMPRASQDAPVAAFAFTLGKVGARPESCWLVLAYDDLYSIQYFRANLRPYWSHNRTCWQGLVGDAVRDYESLAKRCAAFDAELMVDLRKAGGEKYAVLCALAYRQCLAGNKLAADANGQPLLFPKENTSNGCIGTVDVIYPMAPMFLLFGPSLTKAMLVSNLDYASSPRWKWPFAPHDLGTYPKANGQVYGGGERTEENQMPVEETGNMLILVAALAQMEGNADFAAKYWPVLQRWAEYLKAKGFDPENQLSTDDFMGHLAHNTNLSIKATLGLASFAYLCEVRGQKAKAAEYRALAKEFAARWVKEADDGDHFRLAFDKPGSWSQKYNLVWDKILGFNLFPDAVFRKEMAFYRKTMNPFGVSLDSRRNGTVAKTDWSLWTATLTGDAADFDAVMAPVYRFVDESPERVAMGDLYNTVTGHHVGMNARPVVGGLFLKVLYDRAVWKKWAGRDKIKAAGWAPLPVPPKVAVVVPTAEKGRIAWRYTIQEPEKVWFQPGFDASNWKEGAGGFGTAGTPGAVVRTVWSSPDIWLRREFTLPAGDRNTLQLRMHHDEDAEVYINGVLAASVNGYSAEYEEVAISGAGRAALKEGKNVLAIHCHQTRGGQYIDAGLVRVVVSKE